MATPEVNAIAFLLSKDPVKALVQGRIFEVKPVQNRDKPYIVVQRTGTENADTLGGVGEGPLFYGVSIECCAVVKSTANAVADAVRGNASVPCLHEYRGAFGDATAKGCFVDNESDGFDRFSDGSDEGVHTRSLDTRIFL